jgi:predicted transcriptional regulator
VTDASAADGVRHSILDLAPLELECMNALWPLGQATVRDIQQALAATRPRAYTTIMTILDRLAQKGAVVRQKAGRAWLYRPAFSAEEARSRAIAQIVDGFFEGSAEALSLHLAVPGGVPPAPRLRRAGREAAANAVAPAETTRPTQSSEPEAVGAVARGLDASLL